MIAEIVNQNQAARLLGKSPTYVQRKVAAGDLPAKKGPNEKDPVEIPLEAVLQLSQELERIERLTRSLVPATKAIKAAGRSWAWLQTQREKGLLDQIVEYDGKVWLSEAEVVELSDSLPKGHQAGRGITFGNFANSRPVLSDPEWAAVCERAEAARLARLEDLRERFPSVQEAGKEEIMIYLMGQHNYEPPAYEDPDAAIWEAWLGMEVYGW